MGKRTDIHRPSAIDPEAYEFVGVEYQRVDDIVGGAMMLAEERRKITAHKERTGGTYSRHEHGGNCHVCGAHCIYTALFYHPETNVYIRTGFDCADKMHMGDKQLFRAFKRSIHDARLNMAGKAKAMAMLDDAGLSRAWELYLLDEDPTDEPIRECHCKRWEGCAKCDYTGIKPNSWGILCSIVDGVRTYGNLSDKQIDFLRKLVHTVDNWDQIKAEREAKQKAERDAAEPCPTGRVEIIGKVASTRVQEGNFGTEYKMLVIDDRGFKLWGSIPSCLQLFEDAEGRQRALDKGDRIKFTGTIEPSKDDEKFGFYKRPAKAELIQSHDATETVQ